MKDKIAKLINVKSLVTLILTLVVAYKAIMGQMDIEQIYLMIMPTMRRRRPASPSRP